jgi:malate-CoA ligase subunit beta
VILVNIFAGHQPLRLDREGRGAGLQGGRPEIPVVVRLSGTNVEEGRKIIAESGLPIISADTLAEAAEKAVAARPQPVAA